MFNYQLTRSRNGITNTQTMPSPLERTGDFQPVLRAGAGNDLRSADRQSVPRQHHPREPHQQRPLGLLKYYPLPNFAGNNRNYSAPIRTINNGDNINSRLNQT